MSWSHTQATPGGLDALARNNELDPISIIQAPAAAETHPDSWNGHQDSVDFRDSFPDRPFSPDLEEEERARNDIYQREQRAQRRLINRIVTRTMVTLPPGLVRKSIDDVEVRSYQTKLFERAKEKNIIACLPTGSGKTLISVLLLEHTRNLERDAQAELEAPTTSEEAPAAALPPKPRRKVSFFLVNIVPLVHQQANVIATFTDLRVGKIYGELKDEILDNKLRLDAWRAPEWRALMDTHDVIVSTAQCLVEALVHAYIKMDDINLLVFDEAHNAIKNHPYARIMTLYYRLAEKLDRPRIFGLTASPVFSLGDYGEASRQLEQQMDAEIVTAPRENMVDLQSVVNRPVELVAEYDKADEQSLAPTQLSLLMQERCAHVSVDFDKSVWPRIEHSLVSHGALMTDLIWYGSSQEYLTRAQRWQENARKHSSRRTLLHDAWTKTAVLGEELKTSQLSSDAELNRAMITILSEQPPLPAVLEPGPHNCTPKILRLLEVLRCFGCSPASRAAFCGIIFVQRRQTAASLAELIRRVPALDFLKPEWLVGHDPTNGPAMDWHDQVAVLDRFRRRSPTNLLIATSVAEEGIDIQAANVVIRFDLFDRHSGFLQSKGRARSQDSRFIVMAERGNLLHYRVIAAATLTEMGRGDWLAELAEKTGQNENNKNQELEEDELGYNYFLAEPLTGARVYPQDAPSIVAHYVGYLRAEQETGVFARAAFEVSVDKTVSPYTFSCHLKMPANSKVREATAKGWLTKKGAKRMAALDACSKLRQLDQLDEYLMPRVPFKVKWDPQLRDSNGVGYTHTAAKKLPTSLLHFKVKQGFEGWKTMPTIGRILAAGKKAIANGLTPAEGQDQQKLRAFATLLPFDRLNDASKSAQYRSLFLVTSLPLPSTELIQLYGEGGPLNVGAISESIPIELSEHEFAAARRFSEVVLGWVTRRRQMHTDQSVFLVLPASVPSHPEHQPAMVDWQVVSDVIDRKIRNAAQVPIDDIRDAMIIDRSDLVTPGSFYVEEVRHDLNPYSAPLSDTREAAHGCASYFAEYCRARARWSPTEVPPPSPDQPLLSVGLMGRWKNQAITTSSSVASGQPKKSKGTAKSHARMAIPSLSLVHPLPLSVARSGLLLPSVLYRYDDLLLAMQCNRLVLSSTLAPDLVLTALTPPGRNAGFDYERLEFYGDTVLKLLAACQVFTTKLGETEGELHVASKEILVNRVLEAHAMRLRLWKWARFSDKWMKRKVFWLPGWREVGRQEDEDMDDDEEEGMDVDWDDETMRSFVDDVSSGEYSSSDGSGSDTTTKSGRGKASLRLVDVNPSTPLQDRDVIGSKALSDMVEALLGASLFHAGLDGAILTASRLAILPKHITSPSSFHTQLLSLSPPLDESWESRVDTSALSHLESIFNYTFTSRHLALEAFTHPSLLASVLPSYQRLEYLGDAFLDYCIVLQIRQLYPHFDQGEATAMKSNMVSNATLSALCEVLDLTSFIASHSAPLKDAIGEYTETVRALREAEEARCAPGAEARDNGSTTEAKDTRQQYWWTTRNPKACADVVESSIGAVLVDCGFDFERARKVFLHTYWPFFGLWCTPALAVVPNVKVLASLLIQRNKTCTAWRLEVAISGIQWSQDGKEVVHFDDDDDDDDDDVDVDVDAAQASAGMRGVGDKGEAARVRVWNHGVLVGEATEKIRSSVQRDVLVSARSEGASTAAAAAAAASASPASRHSNPNRMDEDDDDDDTANHTTSSSSKSSGRGGAVSLQSFRDVIRVMRWSRPFMPSQSFPHILGRTPPKMQDVLRCDCSRSS